MPSFPTVILITIVVILLVRHYNKEIRKLRFDFDKTISKLKSRIKDLEDQHGRLNSQQIPNKNPIKEQLTKSSVKDHRDTMDELIDSIEKIKNSKEDIQYVNPTPLSPLNHSNVKENHSQILENFYSFLLNYFKTGNTVAKVGVIVLFFGISFLVKFAVDQGYFPIEVRLLAVVIAGIGLFSFGWTQRDKKAEYSLAIQGGGIGILFICTFASLKIYSLIPAVIVFFIFVGLSISTAWLAVKQDSMTLSWLGIVGGFLAPILTSTGQGGSHIVLFSYYALLNLGIVLIVWHKSWRFLNLLGFGFTYIIGSTWGVLKYNHEDFFTTEPFFNFIFYHVYLHPSLVYYKTKN